MLRHIKRRIRKHTKSAAQTFRSSTLGRVFGSKSRKRRHAKRHGCHCASCMRNSARRRPKKWIQGVTRRHPGALRRTVKTRYGRRGFDKHGRIKSEVLTKMSHEKGVTGKRARFAKQLRKMHK